ncbi:hypothetical protein [Vineibacter terrae]|uniref:hypothetical protein n=1 Tax=Vineibacter terrae TaxID=2586908 RepID=UPI0015B3E677|nr:hypothetical protein [Vineibacter terrae]
MTKTNPQTSQSQKFLDAARAAECDEDPAAWDRRLKAIVKAPTVKAAPAKPKAKRKRA